MNIAQQFRAQIGRLSGALQSELDQIVASIQTGWNVEHDAEGHHTDITANSIRANRFNLGNVYTYPLAYAAASSTTLLGSGLRRATFNAVQVPDDTGIVLLLPDDNASVDPAIDAGYAVNSLVFSTAPKNGDVIFIGQHANSVFPIQLVSLAAAGRDNFKFFIPPKMADPDASFATVFTLSGNSGLVPFVYLAAPAAFRGSSATSTVLGAWTLLQCISSRTSPL
jgi:hypothetical protein